MYHSLQVLGTIESLLLLEEKNIARYGYATDGLAVCSTRR
jgi:hypothetical protein